MKRRISSKSETCAEGMDVYAAGISVKAARCLPCCPTSFRDDLDKEL